jgi:hypothetical protein
VRVLRGQFSLCNILCNADKTGLQGFVWFAFLTIFRYLSLLEIAIYRAMIWRASETILHTQKAMTIVKN